MTRARVLVVDDDEVARSFVTKLLERAGFGVFEAVDGREGLRILHSDRPDIVLLDVEMPTMNGWQTLERIRDLTDVPVLMLTSHDAEMEKVRGLRAGADDYVTKPFGREELLARIDALLRRSQDRNEMPDSYADTLVTVDFARREVHVNDEPVALTPLEFRLLTALIRHPGQVLSQDQLLEMAWGDAFSVSRDQVKLYVGYLRKKLGFEAEGSPIETVRGFGYRYEPPAA